MKGSIFCCLMVYLFASTPLFSQQKDVNDQLWNPNTGNDQYLNPIIFADYSDPDVVAVGDDFYMVSSSFSHFPGLPILHSKDLVNWTIIGHAVQNYPFPEFERPQHGNAIWAPSIRYHDGEFYVYFGDPDRGVFMTKAKNPAGPWETLKHVKKVTGWIDTCPFWDEDGKAYLVHAFANSRAGIKSLIFINEMNAEGTEITGDGILVFNGQSDHKTMEGPKFYKRNGYYYIFAPAGGVKTGWQTILRSKNIYGPYEDKIVLEQGSTKINGPHQGAWITTSKGEDWFIHFQDRYAYGRLVILEPMKWENDWPVMGVDFDGNGIGEPVSQSKKPIGLKSNKTFEIQTSDEFDLTQLGLQWQWQSNFENSWYSLHQKPGHLRLFAQSMQKDQANLWDVGSLLLQKIPAPEFAATTKITLEATTKGEKAGLVVFGRDYAYVSIEQSGDDYVISQNMCKDAQKASAEQQLATVKIKQKLVYLKVDVFPEDMNDEIPKVFCQFSYSLNGKKFEPLGERFEAREGQWVGAKIGLFDLSPMNADAKGYADVDWFRITPRSK